jgi:hypothetical protein
MAIRAVGGGGGGGWAVVKLVARCELRNRLTDGTSSNTNTCKARPVTLRLELASNLDCRNAPPFSKFSCSPVRALSLNIPSLQAQVEPIA